MSLPAANNDEGPPILKALSSSARQLTQLLSCVRFASKTEVQISTDGIRFSVENSRVMQGVAFLDKGLFTSYTCNLPQADDEDAEDVALQPPTFQISLPALLETLQILGFSDTSRFTRPGEEDYASNMRPQRPSVFSNSMLNLPTLCRLSYPVLGAPLSITLEESGVVTTCNLNTYASDAGEEIPFDRTEVDCKIIMQARYLLDALVELSVLNPSTSTTGSTQLTIHTSPNAPFLSLSCTGPLGSSQVDFSKSRDLLETFQVSRKWTQFYKFEHVRVVLEALRIGHKVSLRGDRQGVLSLQILVEGEGGVISFVDFRFVPFVVQDGDGSEIGDSEQDEDEDEDDEYN